MKTYPGKIIYRTVLVAGLFVFLFIPAISQAQIDIELEVNYPEIPTPIGPVDLNCLEVGLCNFSIALVILLIYSVSIWVAGLLAFVVLLYTGFTYIAGGASPGARRKAKRMFQNVLWGLAILLLSNALLITINDNILELEDPELLGIQPIAAPVYEAPRVQGEGIDLGSGSVSCFESCMNNCQDDQQECEAQCQDQCSGGDGDFTGDASCADDYEIASQTTCGPGAGCGGGITFSSPEAGGAPITNDDPACNKTIARSMLADYGWDTTEEWNCLELLYDSESSWQADARHPNSCAYGLPQACPGTKLDTAGSDWRYHPVTQLTWGFDYIRDRVGSDTCSSGGNPYPYESPCGAALFKFDDVFGEPGLGCGWY